MACAQLPSAAGAPRGELILPEPAAGNGRARAVLPSTAGAPRAELIWFSPRGSKTSTGAGKEQQQTQDKTPSLTPTEPEEPCTAWGQSRSQANTYLWLETSLENPF